MNNNHFAEVTSLIEFLGNGKGMDFPPANNKKSYKERFVELDQHFSEYPVEIGAMKAEVDDFILKMNQLLNDVSEGAATEKKFEEKFNEYEPIFLNKHGPEHIEKVQEKALEILRCFFSQFPSYYEVFFLLCAISVHDVGNIFGREGHEKKIRSMLDQACRNIIDDSVEKRVIARIAGVHGGSINGNKDTISVLKSSHTVNGLKVREQMLAAVLRFADELADDSTRAIYPALESGILGKKSEIFHVYSSKLHTVKLEENPVTKEWYVSLIYELDEDTAKKLFNKGMQKVYLLDEIYARTIKMERERRYCMRFLRPYCFIEKISVQIIIDKNDSVFDQETIRYTLQEKGYPEQPYDSIKDIDDKIMTGKEMADKLSGQD